MTLNKLKNILTEVRRTDQEGNPPKIRYLQEQFLMTTSPLTKSVRLTEIVTVTPFKRRKKGLLFWCINRIPNMML